MTAGSTPNLWVQIDPGLGFEDPRMVELLDYWRRKRGGRTMPSRADIDPIDLKAHLGNLCLIDVEQNPLRMRYRLIGSNITQKMGRDATGRYYDEIYAGQLLEDVQASFRWIVEHRAPLRTHGQAFYPDKNFYRYEIINLPLADDGTTVNMVLGNLTFRLAGQPPAP